MPFSFRIYESPAPISADGTNLALQPNVLDTLTQEIQEQEAELRRLRQAVMTDPVTGGANLRALDLAFEGLEVADPCGLLVVDVDGFSRVNETLGRTAGDAVLQALARCQERCLRWDDIVAHEGGDRFILLLPFAIEQDTHAVAERLRKTIAKMCFQTEAGRFRITVRIGCSNRRPEDAMGDMVSRSDKACRDGKTHGGDIVFFE
jgi:diguanylate cyclase (GGDEF)-like protein